MEVEERKRENTGMQSTKEKNKKPRTRRVSKYTLSLFPPSLSLSPELKVSSSKKHGKMWLNTPQLQSGKKQTVQSNPKKEKQEGELKDYWLVMTG